MRGARGSENGPECRNFHDSGVCASDPFCRVWWYRRTLAGIREDGPCHPRAVVCESTVHCEVINAHTLACILFRRLRPSETHKLLDLRRVRGRCRCLVIAACSARPVGVGVNSYTRTLTRASLRACSVTPVFRLHSPHSARRHGTHASLHDARRLAHTVSHSRLTR